MFPADNAWNEDVSTLPVHANSANYLASINSSRTTLHPDFGGGGEYGIPFITVGESEPLRAVNWTAYGDESDAGPYPVPPEAPVEGGAGSDGDRHVLTLQRGTCKLFELYRAFWSGDHWDADSGAVWDLRSNLLRTLGWTSADAAGLPILPGLVRYDEVAAGAVQHALRFTVSRTQRGFILPATHAASSSTDPALPPMGLRLRMRADFDLSGYTGQALVILQGLKRYGMIVADNGSSWFITGAADPRWNDDDLGQLKHVPGSAFEVVDTGPIQRVATHRYAAAVTSAVLFTAFFPPSEVLAQIIDVQTALRAHVEERLTWVRPERMHVSVWFLGDAVPLDGLEPALDWATSNLPAPFDITLEGLGTRRVRWGDGHRSIHIDGGGCESLVSIARRLNGEVNRPPHLTLARGRRAIVLPDLDSGRITFPAERLALVRSERDSTDAGYTVIREWNLPPV